MSEKTTFLLDKHLTQKPQINLARSTVSRMWLMNICAFMAIFQSSMTDSYSSMLIALAAVFSAVLTEYLIINRGRGARTLLDGSAVASALILTLLLPNRISPIYAAAGAVFAIAVIKHSFGGLGSNWLNPAAGGWLFVRFSWPGQFKQALEGSLLSGSPFGGAGNLFAATMPPDNSLRSFLNSNIFSLTGVQLPGGYIDLFTSHFPGIIADRGVFALLLGTIIITAFRVNRSWIPLVYLLVFGFLVRMAGALPYGDVLWNGDVIFSICTGGTLVAAFFLAADPASGSKSNLGILIAVIAAGALAFSFRFFGYEPYGAVLSLLLINAILPLLRALENRLLYKKAGD